MAADLVDAQGHRPFAWGQGVGEHAPSGVIHQPLGDDDFPGISRLPQPLADQGIQGADVGLRDLVARPGFQAQLGGDDGGVEGDIRGGHHDIHPLHRRLWRWVDPAFDPGIPQPGHDGGQDQGHEEREQILESHPKVPRQVGKAKNSDKFSLRMKQPP